MALITRAKRKALVSVLFLLLFFCSSFFVQVASASTITTIQRNENGHIGGANPLSLAFISPNTAGNTIVIGVQWAVNVATITSVTDSQGNVYTLIPASHASVVTGDYSNVQMEFAYATNIKAGSNTVTVNFSGPYDYGNFGIYEISPSQLNQVSYNSGNSNNPSAGTITNHAGDWSVVNGYTEDANTFVNGSGWNQDSSNAGGNSLWGFESQTQVAAGPVTGNWSSNSTYWLSDMVSFTHDSVAPTVSMTTPTNGSTVSGTSVTLSANASDDVSLSGVQFKLDGSTNIGTEATSSPYSVIWDSTAVPDGTHLLAAVARDATNNYATSTGISVTVDNHPPTITSFSLSSNPTSLTVPVSSFTATDTIGVTGYQLTESASAPSSSGSGWSGSAPASYTFTTSGSKTVYAWAKDAAGNVSGSLSASVNINIGGGMWLPPAAFNLPIPPTGGFKLKINNGEGVTNDREVTLSFAVGSDIKNMSISNSEDFKGIGQEPYTSSKKWDLCATFAGSTAPALCPEGNHTVYVKFYTSWGQVTQAISSSIALNSGSIALKSTFTLPLSYGSNNSQVLDLQNILQSLKYLPQGIRPNGNFGPSTLSALQKFQEANNISKAGDPGFGHVGPSTRKFLNQNFR